MNDVRRRSKPWNVSFEKHYDPQSWSHGTRNMVFLKATSASSECLRSFARAQRPEDDLKRRQSGENPWTSKRLRISSTRAQAEGQCTEEEDNAGERVPSG